MRELLLLEHQLVSGGMNILEDRPNDAMAITVSTGYGLGAFIKSFVVKSDRNFAIDLAGSLSSCAKKYQSNRNFFHDYPADPAVVKTVFYFLCGLVMGLSDTPKTNMG